MRKILVQIQNHFPSPNYLTELLPDCSLMVETTLSENSLENYLSSGNLMAKGNPSNTVTDYLKSSNSPEEHNNNTRPFSISNVKYIDFQNSTDPSPEYF